MGISRPPDAGAGTLDAAVARLSAPSPTALAVGFSGGLDSTVLLHRLAREPHWRPNRLRAIHVHHGWSAQADEWAAHCVRTCHQWGVPLQILRIAMDRGPGQGGPEAAARRARYAAVAGTLGPDEWFVTAQHAEDQAETLLLQLFRGAGLDGLGAMRERARVLGARVWRPLLAVPRRVLAAYARAHALRWIDDPTNVATTLARGLLRTRVSPTLLAHWPGLVATLGHSAQHLRADSRLLRAQVRTALAACRTLDPTVLSMDALRALPAALQGRVLRAWLRERGAATPPRTWIDRLLCELRSLAPDAQPRWRCGDVVLRGWCGLLAHVSLPDPPAWSVECWDGTLLDLPHDLGKVRWDGPARAWSLGPRYGGERLRWHGRERPLKAVLQALGVPAWQRARLVLLHERMDDGQRILRAVAGVVVDDHLHGALDAGARLQFEAARP